MDESTINVQYDHVRGEPRKAGGDCVACNRCVQVCPSNIDIRHGLQMECIGCTACIDACDEIMRKVKKPEGLIRYASADLQRPRILRPRVMAYSVLLLATLVGFAFACIERTPFSVAVLRATDVPYQVLPNGMVLNHFKVHVLNQSHLPQTYRLILDTTATGAQLTQGQASGSTEPGEATTIHLFIQIPGKELTRQGRARIPLMVEDEATHVKQATALEVVGPMTF
jgi:cytochrome c oxidase accessory protein FixG